MKKQLTIIVGALLITAAFGTGCAAKASEEKIEEMCKNYLKVTGVSKTTDEAAEVERIEKEYKAKGDKLRSEIDRDIKGQEDVYTQRLSDLEKLEIELTEDEIKEEVTVEQKKEALKAKYTASFEKAKKGFDDDYTTFFAKIAPRRDREIAKSKAYVKDRKDKADRAMAKCVNEATNSGVCEELATCRTQAKLTDTYKACK